MIVLPINYYICLNLTSDKFTSDTNILWHENICPSILIEVVAVFRESIRV